ncbi:coxsackievirus and adenovirus receptor homolog [Protopterus annectens]|uniref:coxsackievirus and adenovirus receptor homolog n=1 Tax=Protopterus annectens TaxID=7888 RepID=UPI001CFA3A67|nr:coxsackievirus and adenovirus receptor homolog [Protopterus annectens]
MAVILGLLAASAVLLTKVSNAEMCLHLHAEEQHTVQAGNNVSLPCHLQAKKKFTLTDLHILWGKETAQNEYSVIVNFNGSTVNKFRPGVEMSVDDIKNGNASLLLSDVKVNDSGTYLCDVTVIPTNSKAKVLLQVIDKEDACRKNKSSLPSPVLPASSEKLIDEYVPPRYSYGLITAVVFLLIFGLITTGYVLYRKHMEAVDRPRPTMVPVYQGP